MMSFKSKRARSGNLILHKHSAKAIKQLKRGDDMALHQQRSGDRGDCPPARANGHFIEPLF